MQELFGILSRIQKVPVFFRRVLLTTNDIIDADF